VIANNKKLLIKTNNSSSNSGEISEEEAKSIFGVVFSDYPDDYRYEQCFNAFINEIPSITPFTAKQVTKYCKQLRKFDIEEEGPVEKDDDNSAQMPEDPKIRLFTYWIELFRQEMDPFPKKKADQVEWSAMYGNFFWVSGWALMQLKEEGNDCGWTGWAELTGDELLSLASDFANFIYVEDIKPLLNPESDSSNPNTNDLEMTDLEDPENLKKVIQRIKTEVLSLGSLGHWYFSEPHNSYVFYIEDKKLASKFLKKSEGFFAQVMIPEMDKRIRGGDDHARSWLKIFTAISNGGYEIALDAD
jgi:hypothetical protein